MYFGIKIIAFYSIWNGNQIKGTFWILEHFGAIAIHSKMPRSQNIEGFGRQFNKLIQNAGCRVLVSAHNNDLIFIFLV